jgi:hypothetical protein
VHSTPEILQCLEPCPTFKIRLNFGDHRFILDTLTKVKDDRWIAKFAQKSFSRGFKINRDWKSALQAVHEHTWQKWSLAKDKHTLAPGVAEQTPGEIDPDIFTDLAPVIAAMPAPSIENTNQASKIRVLSLDVKLLDELLISFRNTVIFFWGGSPEEDSTCW